MAYAGEIPLNEVPFFDIATVNGATGQSTNADVPPTFDVFEEDTDVAILASQSMTLRVGATGLYRGTFTCSAANGFEVGKFYSVIANATVASVTAKAPAMNFRLRPAELVVGEPLVDVAAWLGTAASAPTVPGVPNVNAKTWNDLTTVELPLVPTTAGRKLDVSAGGEAGLDWANIGGPTTAQGLTQTTISTTQVVASVSGAVGSVTGLTAADVGAIKTKTDSLTFTGAGKVDASVRDWVGDTIPARLVTGVPIVSLKYMLGNAVTEGGAGRLAAGLTKLWDVATPVMTAISVDQTGDSFARIGVAGVGLTNVVLPAGGLANVSAWTVAITGNITGNLSGSVGSVTDKTGFALTASYDFAKGTVAVTESYAANGVAPTPVQAMMAIHQMLMDFSISGTAYTVKKLDNSATAFVLTLNDATSPTATART